ncbi:glycosyltransferase family 2 protein [Polaromonas sp. YR568]|uniref:glycosyltransferase family 2 protein n=1 Tax=Polaromonas sp. YR568 TaxID=1855301 RepID=UPI00398C1801
MKSLFPHASRAALAASIGLIGLAAAVPAFAQAERAQALVPSFKDYPVAAVMASVLFLIVLIMMLYGVRHFMFTMNRLTGVQRHPYIDITVAPWPMITVFIAAHNEEKVIAGCIEALLNTDYPQDRLKIIPVNDRSKDATAQIIDDYVERYPSRIWPFHRVGGKAGKSAALKDALAFAQGDIAIIFDADYVPGRGLLKQLVAPFFDPEIGAVMGRVVPGNSGANLLTRLLDLERSGGYQVDQQARMNMNLMPQYGGTVGGVRLSAVRAVGGWHDDTLAEDTDITYRLMFNGWKTVYTNRSECYEEVPEDWSVRIKQVTRWAKGHNQVMSRYWWRFATSSYLTPGQRLDGLLLLFVFVVPLIMLAGWGLALGLYFLNAGSLLSVLIPVFALMVYGTLGNFAAFFEIVIAVLIDGNRRRLRLLPFNMLGFLVSLFAISGAVWSLMLDRILSREMVWDKTIRYREAPTK